MKVRITSVKEADVYPCTILRIDSLEGYGMEEGHCVVEVKNKNDEDGSHSWRMEMSRSEIDHLGLEQGEDAYFYYYRNQSNLVRRLEDVR